MNPNIEVIKSPNDNAPNKDELIKRLMEMEQRAIRAEKRVEAVELLMLYVDDMITSWPKVTMRTLWTITDKIATLKQIVTEIRK